MSKYGSHPSVIRKSHITYALIILSFLQSVYNHVKLVQVFVLTHWWDCRCAQCQVTWAHLYSFVIATGKIKILSQLSDSGNSRQNILTLDTLLYQYCLVLLYHCCDPDIALNLCTLLRYGLVWVYTLLYWTTVLIY